MTSNLYSAKCVLIFCRLMLEEFISVLIKHSKTDSTIIVIDHLQDITPKQMMS